MSDPKLLEDFWVCLDESYNWLPVLYPIYTDHYVKVPKALYEELRIAAQALTAVQEKVDAYTQARDK